MEKLNPMFTEYTLFWAETMFQSDCCNNCAKQLPEAAWLYISTDGRSDDADVSIAAAYMGVFNHLYWLWLILALKVFVVYKM